MRVPRAATPINEPARQPLLRKRGARRDFVFKGQETEKVRAKRSRFPIQRRAFKG